MKFLQDERDQLCAALVVFHAQVRNIPKSEKNPFYSSSYADMATVMRHIGPALEAAKLAVIQGYIEPDLQQPNAQAMIETQVLHESGQGFASYVPCVMPYQWNKSKQEYILELGPQASGKTQTYSRRYGLMAALCLAAGGDDDDGESGQERYRDESQPNPGPRTGVTGSSSKTDVRKLKANHPQTCPICNTAIIKGQDIAWRKDQDGRSHTAHWTCFEQWKAAQDQTPPVDDEAALHANAPTEPEPAPRSTKKAAAKKKATGKTAAQKARDERDVLLAAEKVRQEEEQQEADDDSDLPF